ncbi:MAG: MoaD/ThiS family protein [Thermanaeromonas sp.]|uniref:MoaD/ThiS family protein n=1 Tax=Thermanaeromonas sp. TaxID=2003697 RepID=UPI00243CC371|nr:MoaD/ThiS family protein [Thermanaeromonas sp.]MCG0278023.1 MoaD/ThiS family protein [Thermanaeromonas sp.]
MKVELFGFLQRATGCGRLELEAPTVRHLLEALVVRFGERLRGELFLPDGNLRPGFTILVNGRNIVFLKGLDTPLKPEDTVSLIPPAAGGQSHALCSYR